jgi:hypothetical protein
MPSAAKAGAPPTPGGTAEAVPFQSKTRARLLSTVWQALEPAQEVHDLMLGPITILIATVGATPGFEE